MKKEHIILTIIGLIIVVGGGILMATEEPPAEKAPKELQGQEYPIQGSQHIQIGEEHVAYNSNPPTSGPHYATPATRGFYNEVLPDEQLVHNLEHGEIWISYKDLDEATLDELRKLQGNNRGSVIVTHRPANDSKIAVASWGRLTKMDQLDITAIQTFTNANKNNSPEPLAR